MISVITEWLARIEHKLDLMLSNMYSPSRFSTPMEFSADPCPVCKQVVQYQLHPQGGFVTRRCGCKTGKVPTTPLFVPAGESNGNLSPDHRVQEESEFEGTEDRRRGKAR